MHFAESAFELGEKCIKMNLVLTEIICWWKRKDKTKSPFFSKGCGFSVWEMMYAVYFPVEFSTKLFIFHFYDSHRPGVIKLSSIKFFPIVKCSWKLIKFLPIQIRIKFFLMNFCGHEDKKVPSRRIPIRGQTTDPSKMNPGS